MTNDGTISANVSGPASAFAYRVGVFGGISGAFDHAGTIAAEANATGAGEAEAIGVGIDGALTEIIQQ
ncbi:hypothetical protein [Yoonia sp. BS5-3]|uniref:Uncharacterized protein n=1 Tax=Yoonia phaeophyticola TaxID=3137369 RepID=A0ABZ2V3L4_9RHOB